LQGRHITKNSTEREYARGDKCTGKRTPGERGEKAHLGLVLLGEKFVLWRERVRRTGGTGTERGNKCRGEGDPLRSTGR